MTCKQVSRRKTVRKDVKLVLCKHTLFRSKFRGKERKKNVAQAIGHEQGGKSVHDISRSQAHLFCVLLQRRPSRGEISRSLKGFELGQRVANEGKLIGMIWRDMERRHATGRDMT